MYESSDKQLHQVYNILQTIIEVTEHLQKLIKQKELNQSIFALSSLVEGVSAISNFYNRSGTEQHIQVNKLEKYLLEIAQLLETGNLTKISEILQFSALPHLKKMKLEVSKDIGANTLDKSCLIGVFSSSINPLELYPEARINALIKESEKQNTKLLFFTSSDVDFTNNSIVADVFNGGKWERITSRIPDVINNVGVGKRSKVERKLRRITPFTSFHVGNKVTLPKRIVKYRKYAELLVPFKLCVNVAEIYDFIDQNNKVVFKYLLSNRGENIYFVTKKGNRYVVLEHKKEQILNQDDFDKWLHSVVLRKKASFIVQRYIHTRTKENEPYHIRAHVQKNGNGNWVLTYIYPRIGNKKSNLSNVATDGRVEDFHTFLLQEYGDTGKKYEEDILTLSLELAHYLDKLYSFSLDELGIDFAIDENGRYWMHEANNGPQTAFHEEKRAVNTIAYAKYIAEKGIYYADSVQKARVGVFQARTSKLSFADLGNHPIVGILHEKTADDPLITACFEVAKTQNIHLYVFTPKDIDYDAMLIRGAFYENGEWIQKIVEYPDIIFDRIKRRGEKNTQWFYDELEEIPFTNEWLSERYTRTELYNSIQKRQGIDNFVSAYQKVAKTRDIFRYLEMYKKVLLKTENSRVEETLYIEVLPNGKYMLIEGKFTREYNELALLNKLKKLIKEKTFIVQNDSRSLTKNGEAFSIHIHLLSNGNRGWDFVSCYSEVRSYNNGTVKVDSKEDIVECLRENYGEKEVTHFKESIVKLSREIASGLKEIYGNTITEVAIELAVDKNNQLNLIDVNPNGPVTIYNANNYAEKVLTYAKYMASLNRPI